MGMATKRKDFTQIAFDVVRRATGHVEEARPAPSLSTKKQAAPAVAKRAAKQAGKTS